MYVCKGICRCKGISSSELRCNPKHQAAFRNLISGILSFGGPYVRDPVILGSCCQGSCCFRVLLLGILLFWGPHVRDPVVLGSLCQGSCYFGVIMSGILFLFFLNLGGLIRSDKPYLKSQVASNNRPTYPKAAHSSWNVASNYWPLAFQVSPKPEGRTCTQTVLASS